MFKNKTRSHIKRIGNKYLIQNKSHNGGNITRKNIKVVGGADPSVVEAFPIEEVYPATPAPAPPAKNRWSLFTRGKPQNNPGAINSSDISNMQSIATSAQDNPMLTSEQRQVAKNLNIVSKFVPKSLMARAANKALKQNGLNADEIAAGKNATNITANILNGKSPSNDSNAPLESQLLGAAVGEAIKNPSGAMNLMSAFNKFEKGNDPNNPMGDFKGTTAIGGPMGIDGMLGQTATGSPPLSQMAGLLNSANPNNPMGDFKGTTAISGPFGNENLPIANAINSSLQPNQYMPDNNMGSNMVPSMTGGITGMPDDQDAMYKRIYSNICNNIDEVFRKNFSNFSNNIETQITTLLQNPTSKENFERAINATFVSIFNDFTKQYNEDPELKASLNDKILDLIKENLRSYLSANIDKIDPIDAKYLIGLLSPPKAEEYVEQQNEKGTIAVANPINGGKSRRNKKYNSKTRRRN